MLLRVANMRGVDLSIFDFDYDLQWFALMLTPDGDVLGRFGGRDADSVSKYQTLSGLRYSLEAALQRFKNEPDRKRTTRQRRRLDRKDLACPFVHRLGIVGHE